MFLIALVCAASFGAGVASPSARSPLRSHPSALQRRASSPSTAQDGRLAPPNAVTCDRNDLTLYSGRVTSYSRTPARTAFTVETDWDTTERIVIRHPREKSPQPFFLIEGRPFRRADWRGIERRPGVLRQQVRANVWICADHHRPVVDWQGAAEPAPPPQQVMH